MKIVVNDGRTVHIVAKPAVKQADGKYSRPVVKAHGPTQLLDLPDDDAKHLISRGFARKFEEPKKVEAEKPAG